MTLAVGFFDGVHRGHQAILRGADVAVTFRNHPLSLLAPARAPKLIMSPEERIEAIRACGVRRVVALDFTRELAGEPPEGFLKRLERLEIPEGLDDLGEPGRSPLKFRCGANWRFGAGGIGCAAWLRERGFEAEEVGYAEYGGERVSSSRIRAAIAAGEIAAANAMLGRALAVSGEMVSGKGEGRTLGYPTVNLKPVSPVAGLLPHGVYEVEADGAKGVANFGFAPTYGERAWPEPVLEVHFLQRSTFNVQPSTFNLQPSTFHLLRFLRPERKFGSAEELKRQIAEDCATVTRNF